MTIRALAPLLGLLALAALAVPAHSLEIEAFTVGGRQLIIAGTVQPGSSVAIEGAAVPVQIDGSFEAGLLIAEGVEWRQVTVSVTTPDGQTTEHNLGDEG